MIPVWPRMLRCAVCRQPRSSTHRGQHDGVRDYRCDGCGHAWVEAPIAWRVLVDGIETVRRPEELDALPNLGAHAASDSVAV